MTVVNVDGELVPEADATVHVRDRGFLYGDALFETLRAYGGEIFAWPQHWERLDRGCETIALHHGFAGQHVRDEIERTLAANELEDAYVRLSITRGRQSGRLAPRGPTDATLVIIVEPLPRGGIGGTEVWDEPAICAMTTHRHVADAALPAHLKSHNYLNGILARIEANSHDADEAILLDGEGYLTEGTITNLFFVTDGTLCTPSLDAQAVLPGVTRAVVLDVAGEADLPVRIGSFRPDDLATADEVFLTNTTWEIRPVERVDEHTYSVGPISTRLAQAVDELIETRCYRE